MRADSVRVADSLFRLQALQADSLFRVQPPVRDTLRPALRFPPSTDSFYLQNRLFFRFGNPVRYGVSEKKWEGKEPVFYGLVALLLFFAFVKNSFRRYLSDLYSAYFRTTVRQKQIKEQLLQSPLPSILFNVFFVASAAVFVSLLARQFGYSSRFSFGLLVAYSAAAVALIYVGKFVLLKFFGWVFQQREAADAYIFVVFSTNKILGISLLPFSILLAFVGGTTTTAVLTLSAVVVVGLLVYRFFLAFISINHLVKLNFFHFLLYLAAFEILPVLLINKLLFTILREIA